MGQSTNTLQYGDLAAFPSEVREHITKEGDARLCIYDTVRGAQHVIHSIGPDLRRHPYTEEGAEELSQEVLAAAHVAVLVEYARTQREQFAAGKQPLQCLRLLPMSGGIFSGKYYNKIPDMTLEALARGFGQLSAVQQQSLWRKA